MPSATARKKYPAQIVIVTTDEVNDRIREKAAADGVSIAEVARGYLEAGIAAEDDLAERDADGLGRPITVRTEAAREALGLPPATRPAAPSSSAFTL